MAAIYEVDTAWKSIKRSTLQKSWRKILPEDDEAVDIQSTENATEFVPEVLQTLHEVGCSDVDEDNVRKWLNEDKDLAGHEVLNDEEIVQLVSMEGEQTATDQDEEDLIPEQTISHSTALTYAEGLLDYLEQQPDSMLADKLMPRNLRSAIRSTVNQNKKQTSLLSYFNK